MSEITQDTVEEHSQGLVDTPPSSVDDFSKPADDAVAGEELAESEDSRAGSPQVKVAFPRLGGNGSSSSGAANAVSWGSTLKFGSSNSTSFNKGSKVSSSGSAKPMRSKTIQEVFSLDLEAQYQITKAEFSSIVQSVKQKYDVSVESTLSKSSRTFLISGGSEKIGLARRDLVKKLTKPVNITFEIPSKTRSAIIGSGGKTIRAISEATGVKIDVPKEVKEDSYDEDLEDYNVDVSLHGDAESVNVAKAKILQIVKEETRNARVSVPIEDTKLVPFVELSSVEIPSDVTAQIFSHSAQPEIVLTGARDDVKLAKVKVINYLNELGLQIVSKKEKVPFKFHSLIDAEVLKEKFNVQVRQPESSVDDQFTFVGPAEKVQEAIIYSKNSSKYYIVESLEISKAHGKNVQHAKHLALYFNKYNVLRSITAKYPEVKIVLPNIETLPSLDAVTLTLVAKNDFAEDIKTVRKQIVLLVNDLAPEQTLIISDLDYQMFHKEIKQILVASEGEYPFVQLGDYFPDNDDILVIVTVDAEDFKPSEEELKSKLDSINNQLEPVREKQHLLASKTIALPGQQQDELFGKGTVTLELIKELLSRVAGNALVKLHSPSADKITVRGDEQGCKLAASAINSIIERPSKESTTAFHVPSNVVSRLIGPKGATIQKIREKFDVQMVIPQDSNGENAEVTLTGSEFNVEQAKAYILAEAKKFADVITKELIVPSKYHRFLIGPQGAYRIRLENKYSVFIKFPKDGEVVIVRGPSRGVKGAYDELKALLEFEIENGHKEIITVPVDHVSRIIGKNGETINDIKDEFGVQLNFLDKDDSEKAKEVGEVELEVTGSRSGIKQAAAKVNAIIQEASNMETVNLDDIDPKWYSDIVGRSGSQLKEIISKAGGDDIKIKRVRIPDANAEEKSIVVFGPSEFVKKVTKQIRDIVNELENSTTEELSIPQEKFGALVGPGGSVRRDLESEFRVKINVPNRDQTDQKVSISGSASNIEACKNKINKDILKDSYDVEVKVPSSYHSFVSNSGLFIQTLRNEYSVDVSHGNLTRTAQQLSRTKFQLPENAAGSDAEKFKVTIEKIEKSEPGSAVIPWRLTYSPIDLSDVLGEEYKKEVESKDVVMKKVTDLINQRIEEAKDVDTTAFIWAKDPKKFNSVVGPGGRNVKEIRNATKTVIHVPRKNEQTNNVIYVRGPESGVNKAVELITKSL